MRTYFICVTSSDWKSRIRGVPKEQCGICWWVSFLIPNHGCLGVGKDFDVEIAAALKLRAQWAGRSNSAKLSSVNIETRGQTRGSGGRRGSWRNCHQLYVSEPRRTVSHRGAVRASGTFEAGTRGLPPADRNRRHKGEART